MGLKYKMSFTSKTAHYFLVFNHILLYTSIQLIEVNNLYKVLIYFFVFIFFPPTHTDNDSLQKKYQPICGRICIIDVAVVEKI